MLAGISVGASHLVQSTRAGADYGLALILIIIAACIIKYPAFRFGAQYASLSGTTLLHGYRSQGKWAVAIYALVALGTMFAAIPAVTLVTAGLAQTVFGIQTDTLVVCAFILVLSSVFLIVGGYPALDRIVKVVMALLVICTLAATALVIPKINWALSGSIVPPPITKTNVLFIAALIGWMPVSVDISVWHSLWSVAKTQETGHRPTPGDSLWDFHVGYYGTIVLAICFVILGAGTMHGSDTQYAPSAAGFAEQLIQIYVATLGPWSAPIIGGAAFLTMLSTVITGIDGYPRVIVELIRLQVDKGEKQTMSVAVKKTIYAASIIIIAIGSFLVLSIFLTSLRLFIDVAATIAFLVAPLIAILNHRAMYGPHIPQKPGPVLRILSLLGIVILTLISGYYFYLQT